MESQRDRPVGKRRWWRVVAVVVLAIVSLGAWGLWPAIDPRLVGEWQLAPGDPEALWPELTLKIRPDGLADHMHLPSYPGRAGEAMTTQVAGAVRFKISGDQFEARDDSATGLMLVYVTLNNLVHGRRPEVFSKGRIVSVDAERLVLTFELWGELVFLRAKDGTLDERMRARSTGPVFATPGAARGSER